MVPATLLVVIDPTQNDQIALKRAEQIAVDSGAALHLFCCDFTDDFTGYRSRKDAKQSILNGIKDSLEFLAEPLRKEGLSVRTEAYWNQNWRDAIVHACSRTGADMVLKSSFRHSRVSRQLQKTSDITLLRHAPCATLLVKDGSPWMEQRLVAALCLDAADSGHELLNNAIITEGQRLAKATQSELHIAAAFHSDGDFSLTLDPLVDGDEEETDEDRVAETYGIPASRVHFRTGAATSAIVGVCDELKADALIIGTVARRGINGALIGNTAEKILDQLDTDILVVN